MDNQAASPQPDSVDSPPVSYRDKELRSSYAIYLLTVWFDSTENAGDSASWRFRLENPRTKETRGFVGVEALVTGMTAMIGESIRWHSERPKTTD